MALLFGAEVDAEIRNGRGGRARQEPSSSDDPTRRRDPKRRATRGPMAKDETQVEETEEQTRTARRTQRTKATNVGHGLRGESTSIMAEVEENPPDQPRGLARRPGQVPHDRRHGDANEDWEDGPTTAPRPVGRPLPRGRQRHRRRREGRQPRGLQGRADPGRPDRPRRARRSRRARRRRRRPDEAASDKSFDEKAKTDEDALADDDAEKTPRGRSGIRQRPRARRGPPSGLAAARQPQRRAHGRAARACAARPR